MTTNYEYRAGDGSAFRNKNKTEDRQPGYTGKVMLPNGELRRVSVWVKKTKAGEPYLSFSIGDLWVERGQAQGMVLDSAKPFAAPVTVAPVVPAAQPASVGALADMDDDLPF